MLRSQSTPEVVMTLPIRLVCGLLQPPLVPASTEHRRVDSFRHSRAHHINVCRLPPIGATKNRVPTPRQGCHPAPGHFNSAHAEEGAKVF